MAKRGIPAKHRLGPVLIRLNGDRAVASFPAIIDLRVKLKGIEGTLSTHARFLYRAEHRRGEWRLFGFDAVYMRDELTSSIPGQTIAIELEELKQFRPSYRLLCYYLKTQGFSIDSRLAGEDRPDRVDALYRELFSWASLPTPT